MTLKDELIKLTLAARTPEAETNSIVEAMKEAAEIGMDTIRVYLDTENEYAILANLTNEYCTLDVECIDEQEKIYDISWM